MQKLLFRIILCLWSWLSLVAFGETAQTKDALGIGLVAHNLLQPVSLFSNFVQTGCFVIGGSFLFASIVKYIEHRRSPLMVPISTVVFLLIGGIALILLPFLSYLTGSGVNT